MANQNKPRDYLQEDEHFAEDTHHSQYGSGAFEDIAEAFDQDAELLAANMGWD